MSDTVTVELTPAKATVVASGSAGPTGVVAANAPATYDLTTRTIGVTIGTTAGTAAAGDALAAAVAAEAAHVASATAHAASHVTVAAGAGVTSTDVQAAVAEITGMIQSQEAGDSAAVAAVAAGLASETTRATTAEATKQAHDADLDTIAALDSTTAGALVTDGAGWIRKTYTQLKTALGLVKADVGLGNVDNTSDANKPVSTAQALADGTRLNWRGAWAATTAYVTNDVVSFNGGLYRAPSNFTSGGSFVLANWVELVAQTGTYASAGGALTAPLNAYGLRIIEPASTTGGGALRLTDRSTDSGGGNSNTKPLLEIAHEGSGNAVDIFNYSPSTNLALAVHNYQSASAVVQFDNTGSGAILKLSNAQNSSANPGSHGTGDYIQFSGPYVFDTTSTGASTGSNTLVDATAAFAAEDVGKPIKIGGFTGTVATFVSATQITYSGIAGLADGNYSYSYAKATGIMLKIDKTLTYTNQSTTPVTFLSSTGTTRSLQVQQGAGATADVLSLLNQGTGKALVITQNTAAGTALSISHSVASTGVAIDTSNAAVAGNYGATLTTFKFGLSIVSTADHSSTTDAVLKVSKSTATGSGSLVLINNPGTGSTLVLQTNGTSHLEFNANGDVNVTNTNGWKIGTATTQKLGFFNKTPVVQPSGTPADATDLATAIALVNSLKASLVSLGLVA